ncbi:hypothetical protein GCM10022220_09130 [Actinocatenispora rupis]|uniref:Uncharacterized protein n=2 Tax=Actinocatenispora rupis TaxID=519421 RepID=A0A8J3J4P1_9ACTN|nr:hypothetical protein Aru02nite_09780 [Actinocatenispora rupis]
MPVSGKRPRTEADRHTVVARPGHRFASPPAPRYGRAMKVFLVLLLALVLLVILALVSYGWLMVRSQRRALAELRQNGLAFLCRPTMGMQSVAGFVLSVDRNAVALWKVGLGRPVRKHSFPSSGATVAPATVKVNLARSSPGLSVLSPAAARIDVAIYPDPTMSYSAPIDGASLVVVCEKIQETLTGGGRPDRPR